MMTYPFYVIAERIILARTSTWGWRLGVAAFFLSVLSPEMQELNGLILLVSVDVPF